MYSHFLNVVLMFSLYAWPGIHSNQIINTTPIISKQTQHTPGHVYFCTAMSRRWKRSSFFYLLLHLSDYSSQFTGYKMIVQMYNKTPAQMILYVFIACSQNEPLWCFSFIYFYLIFFLALIAFIILKFVKAHPLN